jgi:hypothetical protein
MLVPNAARAAQAKCGDDPRKVFGLAAQNTCENTTFTSEIQLCRRSFSRGSDAIVDATHRHNHETLLCAIATFRELAFSSKAGSGQ